MKSQPAAIEERHQVSGEKVSSREVKRMRVRTFLEAHELDGILITLQPNFAWYTGGADSHVNVASEESIAELLVTRTEEHLFVNSTEHERLRREELQWDFPLVHLRPWWEEGVRLEHVRHYCEGRVASDASEFREQFSTLRYTLLPVEVDRYRRLGKDVADSLWELRASVVHGMSEHDLAAEEASKLIRRDITPLVLLVAFDERIKEYRHPLPSDKKLRATVMMSVCGRRSGLVISATRMMSLQKLSEDVAVRSRSVAAIDAWLHRNTLPGVTVASLFDGLTKQYEKEGYPQEWRLHHQGGATGYTTRDFRASASCTKVVQEHQAYAWNPTISGVKSEDTILAEAAGPETLSADARWPSLEFEVDGSTVRRPDVLILS